MAQSRKKIAFVANTARSFLLFRSDLIRHYVDQGHEVFCLAPKDGTAGDSIQALGAKYHSIPLSRAGLNPLQEIASFKSLYQQLSAIKPDFIVSYTIKPNTYVPVIASMLNVPCLAVVTGLGFAFMSQSLKAKIAAKVFLTGLKHADNIWFLNEADKMELSAIAPGLSGRSSILPGEGVNPDFYAPVPKTDNAKTVFLMIARILKDKGIQEFASAAKEIKSKYKDVEFRVLGDLDSGNPTGLTPVEWKAILNEGNLTHLGSSGDVRPYIAESDCIVLPSYREGIPRVLLEGASMAKPMIATDVPGCSDVVKDGGNGYLCQAMNVASLVGSMEKFLSLREEEKAEMGQKARQTVVEKFSNEIVIEKYDRIILSR